MGFEDFEPIFGKAKAEWSSPDSPPLRPFLFHVHALSPSRLRIHVSDFHSSTYEVVRSIEELEDMLETAWTELLSLSWRQPMLVMDSVMRLVPIAEERDMIGIGGSWSEFMDYLISSIKSDDVKVVLQGSSRSTGAANARFVAQKTKGMPLISIKLAKLSDSAASEAMANLSLELYKAFKSTKDLRTNEQERCDELAKAVSAEREKNENIQRQLDSMLYPKRQKSDMQNGNDALASSGLQASPAKAGTQNLASSKVTKRVVPAFRRSKVRGALLQDTEDDGDK